MRIPSKICDTYEYWFSEIREVFGFSHKHVSIVCMLLQQESNPINPSNRGNGNATKVRFKIIFSTKQFYPQTEMHIIG
jgi:hypothetical protein